MHKPRVFIADDHAMILEALGKLLEPVVNVIGTASNGREVVSIACRLEPEIILLDISMPGLNGIEAAQQLIKRLPATKLIFLTMHDDAEYVADAMRLGASGYVLKSSAPSELIEAIQKVAAGERYVSPALKVPDDIHGLPELSGTLTGRQREILQLMAEGRCPKEISSQLGISVRTVEFHKYGIMEKLGLHTIAELTKFAIRHRLTE